MYWQCEHLVGDVATVPAVCDSERFSEVSGGPAAICHLNPPRTCAEYRKSSSLQVARAEKPVN